MTGFINTGLGYGSVIKTVNRDTTGTVEDWKINPGKPNLSFIKTNDDGKFSKQYQGATGKLAISMRDISDKQLTIKGFKIKVPDLIALHKGSKGSDGVVTITFDFSDEHNKTVKISSATTEGKLKFVANNDSDLIQLDPDTGEQLLDSNQKRSPFSGESKLLFSKPSDRTETENNLKKDKYSSLNEYIKYHQGKRPIGDPL